MLTLKISLKFNQCYYLICHEISFAPTELFRDKFTVQLEVKVLHKWRGFKSMRRNVYGKYDQESPR